MKATRNLWIAFGIILFFQDFLKVIMQTDVPVKYFDDGALFLLLLFMIIWSGFNRKLYIDKVTMVGGALFVYSVVLELYHAQINLPALIGIFYIMKVYFLYLLAQNMQLSRDDLYKIMDFFGAVFIIFGIIGIIDVIFKEQLLVSIGYREFARFGQYRLHSLFIQPHPIGWLAAVFSFYYLLRMLLLDGERRTTLFKLIFSIILLILTNNRKSFVGFGIASVLMFFMFLRKKIAPSTRRRLYFATAIIGVIFLIFGLTYAIEMYNSTVSEYSPDEGIARIELYRAGVQIFLEEFPFGSGLGTFGSVGSLSPYSNIYYKYGLNEIYGLTPSDPRFAMDAFWAGILGELGFLGTAIFLTLIGMLLSNSFKAARHAHEKEDLLLAIFASYLVFEAIIEAFTGPLFIYILYMYFAVAIPAAVIKNLNTKKTEEWQ